MDQTYRIVARGLKQGYAAEQAAAMLAGLLKRSAEQVTPLLRGRDIVVKKRLSLADAAKYQTALERCGCLSAIEPEADAGAPALLSAEDVDRINAHAQQIRNTLSKQLGAEARFDMRSVEWLANNLNTRRDKYTGELGVKVANFYGAFLGKVLIDTYADALPVWVKTREGVGIHFRNPKGRLLKVVYPIARVGKQIEHGDEYSILTFMRAQEKFGAETPAAPKAVAAPMRSFSDGAAPPVTVLINDTEDGPPLAIVIPHSMCCNCGTGKEIHSIPSVLSIERYDGSKLTVSAELPFCVPCVPSANRVRPNAVFAAVAALVNRVTPPQTSHYQPLTLKSLNDSADGIASIGFTFTNPLYEKEFGRANKQEMDMGRIV